MFFDIVFNMNASNPTYSTINRIQAEHSRRINNALEFIKQHLDQTIQLDDVMKASYFSSYHFHRLFHA